jgi:arylsulfatase A-like enzyme
VATFSPHAPYTPAPRDANAFPGLTAPRTAAFDAAPAAGTPSWLARQAALSSADRAKIDHDFRLRAQSVLSIDALIGALQNAVAAIGETENTYFVFSSDNGYHMGEHRLMPGKMTAFDTDIHVPLIITGPGAAKGLKVNALAENIDLCPTFTEWAGMIPSQAIDGRSLAHWFRGETVSPWRKTALIEHHGPVRNASDPDLPRARGGNPTTYEALRGSDWVYVEYANGEREFHDHKTDPDELHNTYAALPSETKNALAAQLGAISHCRGTQDCANAESDVHP